MHRNPSLLRGQDPPTHGKQQMFTRPFLITLTLQFTVILLVAHIPFQSAVAESANYWLADCGPNCTRTYGNDAYDWCKQQCGTISSCTAWTSTLADWRNPKQAQVPKYGCQEDLISTNRICLEMWLQMAKQSAVCIQAIQEQRQ